jgi:foldase protein PrsA
MTTASTRRQVRTALPLGACLALILAGYAYGAEAKPVAPSPAASSAVAVVGQTRISRDQFTQALVDRMAPLQLVRDLDRILLQRGAKTAGVTATPVQIDAKVRQAEARAGSPGDLDAFLKRYGLSMGQYRRELTLSVLWDALAAKDVTVTAVELDGYYAQYRKQFGHDEQVRLLLYLGSTRENAEAFKQMLDAGGDFAALAKQVSEDSTTKERGGDTGWIGRGDYAKEITDVAFTLKVGQVSDIIKAPDGWVVVRLEEVRAPGERSYEEVRPELARRIAQVKLRQTRKAWLVKQRKAAPLSITEAGLRASVQRLLELAPGPAEYSFYGEPPGI